jgi:hypothetical protein
MAQIKLGDLLYRAAFHGLRLPLYLLKAIRWALWRVHVLALRAAYVVMTRR